jgi:hypothetical protein
VPIRQGTGSYLVAFALPAGLYGVLKYGCYVVDVAELPGGDADDQVICLVAGQGQPTAVKAVERVDSGEREPLAAVGKCVVAAVECSNAAALASRSG